MIYKNRDGLNFPWEYDQLQEMPLYKIDEVYEIMDEIFEMKKKTNKQ